MKIAIGCDDAAYQLKVAIKEYLESDSGNHEIVDFGCKEDDKIIYPDIANRVAHAVASKEYDRGILFCGTGIGMCISANKVPGIRAAVCHDAYSTERSRKSNNAQIMCMGSRVIGLELAKYLLDIWLNSDFNGGRSGPKVQRINELEKENISKYN